MTSENWKFVDFFFFFNLPPAPLHSKQGKTLKASAVCADGGDWSRCIVSCVIGMFL